MKKIKGNKLKQFIPYMKPYWWAFVIAPLCMLLEVNMDLKLPTLMQQMVDVGIASGDYTMVKDIGIKMIVYAVIGAMGGISCGIFATIASLNFTADLRAGLFKKVQSFSFGNMDQFQTGSIITRMTNDLVQITQATQMGLRVCVRAPLILIGSVIYVIKLNAQLATVLLFVLPVIILIIFIILKIAYPQFEKLQIKLDNVNTVLQENLAGVRVVKAFAKDEYEVERFTAANQSLKQTATKGFRVIALFMPLITLVLNMAIVVALYMGGSAVVFGELPVGAFLAYLQYLSRLLIAVTLMTMIGINLVRAKASVKRVAELLEVQPCITNDANESQPKIAFANITFDNVSFAYKENSDEYVLKNISFTVNEGETVAILGATGSGKSSLIRLIPRLYDVSKGELKIDGINVKYYALENLRKNIGISLQQPILFSGTIEDNIKYGNPQASEEAMISAAKAAEAHAFISKMPNRYQSHIEQKGVNLSGGQKQRIAIARALLINPKILILDDSTSAVDVQTERRIQKALKTRLSDTTTFIVAQRISTVLEADKILVLEDGKLVAEGTHETLLKTSEVYQDIFESQLGSMEEAL